MNCVGNPDEAWTALSWFARPTAVPRVPASREIDDRYLAKALPVIHEQLAKAAVRLAGGLNRAFGRRV